MAKTMKAPGRYIQGPGELTRIGKHVKGLGSRFLVILSPGSARRFKNEIQKSLEESSYSCYFELFNGECTLAEIQRLSELGTGCQADGIIAVGGGKALDTGKAVGVGLELPVTLVPTAASNDSPCSGLSVVYNEEGVVVKVIFGKRNPDLVLVDSSIILKAPRRLLAAGMGDALATCFEARAAAASGAANMARGNATCAALALAELCYSLLMENGVKAMEALDTGECTEAFEKILEVNILLSGIGFESGGLAAAHAVNDGFACIPQAHNALHGEKVAFGTLVQLILEKTPEPELHKIYEFCRRIGLPTTLDDLGIHTVNRDEIEAAAKAACVPAQSTKNLPFPVTEAEVAAAIYKADQLGRQWITNNV